jgi:hypothetical protein
MSLMSLSQKHEILRNMKELEMHKKLKKLFERLFPTKQVYIGQGTGEYGKDLVIIEKDPFSGEKITALVVKMGNLNGKADNGIIGTINTQINQAFNVETFFKEIGRGIKANEVIVIIFGNISNNLDKTLNGYLTNYPHHSIQVKHIDDMTPLFETYYPDIFTISSEAEELEKKFNELNKLLIEKNKYISQCYIEPNLKTFEKTKSEILVAQATGELSDSTLKDTMFGKRENIQSLLKLLLIRKHFILVEGDAGSGKSIFTIKMIQYSIEESTKSLNSKNQTTIKCPVLLKASSVKNLTEIEIRLKIEEYYSSNSTIKPNILIIDGIDEVNVAERNLIIKYSENYCNQNGISLLITTRKDQDISNQLKNYNRFELLPFELSQAIEFLKRMAGKNQNLINSLLKNIQELQHQIPMTPMSLVLLIEIAEKYNEIPASISELYDRYINMVIGVDNTDTNVTQLFEPRYKLDFLISISYELFFKNSDSTVSKKDFDYYIENYVSKHTHITSKEDFLSDLKRITILQINCSSVSFSHKSFLDYLIAKYFEKNTEFLISENIFNDIYALYYTALWEDVTNFYFGLKNSITEKQIELLISKNPYKESDNLMYNLELYSMGRLLQYAWNTEKQVKKYGIHLAIKNILELRECIHDFNKKTFGVALPKIIADATLMQYTDTNYSSVFLKNEIVDILEDTRKLLVNSNNEINLTNQIYFLSSYFLINNKTIDKHEIENFIELLISSKNNIDADIYFPLTFLYKLFTENNKIKISEDNKILLNEIFKTFRRKYSGIFNDTLLFKNRIAARKFNNIGK